VIILALLIGIVVGWYGNENFRLKYSDNTDTESADTEIDTSIPGIDPTVNNNFSGDDGDENIEENFNQ